MNNNKQAPHSPSIVGPRPADQVLYEQKQYQRLKIKARNMRRRGWNKNSPSYKFYAKQDWKALREDLNSEIAENGAYRYGSVAAFIRAKFKSAQEQRFARWVIGTQPVKYLPWLGNWALERFLVHWKQDARVQALCEKLAQEMDAQRLVATTAELWADYIGRIITMQAQIDELYGGRLFLEGHPKKANQARANEYREWVDWGMNALAKAVDGMMDALCGKQRIIGGMLRQLRRRDIRKRRRAT